MFVMSKVARMEASKEVAISTEVSQKPDPFKLADEQIRRLIYETHGRPDDSFDADALFVIVENILKRSTQIVDEVMQDTGKVPLAKLDESIPKANFNVPMGILKKIGCELLCCKAPSAGIAHETTLTILEKLRYYSWEAKAVLTLAAFAREFGDLLHLVQLDQSNTHDQLTKSLQILKGSPVLAKCPELRHKHRVAVVELNNLIKATLKVMETIFKLEKLSIYDPKSIAELPIAVDVYWIIMTVIACASKVTILISDEDKPHDLTPYQRKVQDILSTLTRQLTDFRIVKEEEDRYCELLKLWKTSNEVMEFLKLLFFADRDADQMQLIDGSNNYKTVDINVLKKKKVLLVVSRPDISDADINIFRKIQFEKIRKEKMEDRYAIVWVPIVDEKRPEYKQLKKEFESWLRSKDMEWYTVRSFVSNAASLKFLKEEWKFEGSPAALAVNIAEGKFENLNALHTIRFWGLEAFPFDKEAEQRMVEEMNWIHTFFKDFPLQCTKLANWVKKEKYIFLHGGTDKQWAREIEEKVNLISKEYSSIRIKRFDIEEKGAEVKERFWSGVDGLFSTKIHKQQESFSKRQIERLLSYKNAGGWFTLIKGPTTVVVGDRATLSKMVEEFHKWKENVRLKSFEVAFKEYHEKVVFDPYSLARCVDSSVGKWFGCCVIEVPMGAGKLRPEGISCPVCGQSMEVVTYKCCHGSKVNMSLR